MNYVGLDIHTENIVYTVLSEEGNVKMRGKILNNSDELIEFLKNFEDGDLFVMESTGFYEPIYDAIESKGFKVKLANPLKVKLIAESRIKNDKIDSEILARLLKNNWVPESYVPDKKIREIRRIVRTRINLKRVSTGFKNRIYMELKRLKIDYDGNLFTLEGKHFLTSLNNFRINIYLNSLEDIEKEIKIIENEIQKYSDIEEVKLLMTIPGIGLFSALIIYSEIGDINRFSNSRKLISYAGLSPTTRQSSDVIYHGHITRQGSPYLRWILTECIHIHLIKDSHSNLSNYYRRMVKRIGKKKAIVASASKLLKIIYWVLKEKREYIKNYAQ
jgi:Transposase and inactivated derivatives